MKLVTIKKPIRSRTHKKPYCRLCKKLNDEADDLACKLVDCWMFLEAITESPALKGTELATNAAKLLGKTGHEDWDASGRRLE